MRIIRLCYDDYHLTKTDEVRVTDGIPNWFGKKVDHEIIMRTEKELDDAINYLEETKIATKMNHGMFKINEDMFALFLLSI